MNSGQQRRRRACRSVIPVSANPRVSIAAPARTLSQHVFTSVSTRSPRTSSPPLASSSSPSAALCVHALSLLVWASSCTRRTASSASHDATRLAQFLYGRATCSRGASRRVGRPSSVARSGARGVGLRARLRRRLASRRARSATQCRRSREKRTFMVDSSSPSVARRSRRRVTRGARFLMSRARSAFIRARHSSAREGRTDDRGVGGVEWVNGPRECVSCENISTTRCTTRRGSGELTR